MKSFNRITLFLLLGIFLFSFTSAFNWTDGSLVAYYPFNETTGDVLCINNETLNGTITLGAGSRGATGIIEQAIDFDGSTTYVAQDEIEITGTDFSFSTWIKPDNMGSNFAGILATQEVDPNIGGFLVARASSGNYRFIVKGSPTLEIASGNFTEDGTNWYHLAGTYNGSHVTFYFDGQLIGTTTETDSLTSTGIYIGRYQSASFLEFDGTIDEVGIWNRALTPTEISELYNNGTGLAYGLSADEITVILKYPTNNLKLSTDGTNFTTNITSSQYNLTNATYHVWNINGTLFNQTTVSVSGLSASTDLFIDFFTLGEDYLWNLEACNTEGTCAFAPNNFTFFNLPFTETNITYNSEVIETSGQTFKINIEANPSVNAIAASFWYDGTEYSSTPIDLGSGNYRIINVIDIPLTTNGDEDKSFYWEIMTTLNSGATVDANSTVTNQSVKRSILVLCNATYNTQFINFTTRDAENPFPIITSSFKTAWEWYEESGSGSVVRTMAYEDVTETQSTYAFCYNLVNDTFITTSQIETDRSDYAQNQYFLTEASLTNNTQEIDLYLINDSLATITEFQVEDSSQVPIEDVLITIQLFDVGTDAFYTVAMAKTSFNGKDIAYLNWYDSLYKIILTKDGEVLKTTTPYRISETPQIFEIGTTTTYTFDKFRDFQYSLIFNNATDNFVLTFIKPDATVDQGCLRVIKRNSTNDYEICNICETSSSATLYCNIANQGNGTFIGAFYATGSWDLIDVISEVIGVQNEIYELLGNQDATVYAILFAGITFVMFLVTPALGVIGLIIGLLGSIALGFQPVHYFEFIGIVLVGGIVAWFLNR